MLNQSRIHAHDDVMLAVDTFGHQPASIVLIHGFADGKYLWEPFSASLADAAGVLTMDLRGHGDSAWDPDSVYDIAKFVADVQLIMDRMCSNDLTLVGHSMGAEIAIRLAVANHDRVRALALIDGGPGVNSAGIDRTRSFFASRMRAFASRDEYAHLLQEWMPLADPVMVDRASAESIVANGNAFISKCDPSLADMGLAKNEGELWHMLESLHCKKMLVRGEASAVLSRPAAANIAQRASNLQFETVSMAGHAVMMDNPGEFGAILQGFIDGIYRKPNAPSTHKPEIAESL